MAFTCDKFHKKCSWTYSETYVLIRVCPIFREFICPKHFEVAMLRRTCGPKVLYSEVHLVRMLLCSEDSIFRKALHYMDSMLRRFFSPKFLYFEGCCVPKILFSEHRPWYTDSVLRRFFSPKFWKLYIVCSHHSPNDYLLISVIRLQWVCSPKSNVRQHAHPISRGSYFCKQRLKVCEIDL